MTFSAAGREIIKERKGSIEMSLPRSSEIVIVGGGFVGTSIAYQLSKRGMQVVLLERNEIARQGSGTNWGFVWVQTHPVGDALDLVLASSEMFERLSDELSFDVEYSKCGGMMPIESEEDLEPAERIAECQRKAGLNIRLLRGCDARQIEPALSRELAGAVYSPADGKVNPLYLTLGFAQAARKSGARIFTHTRVRGIEVKERQIQSVVTNRGRIRTNMVVNAAGAWTRQIGAMVGAEIPVVAHRGEVVVTEPLSRLFSHVAYSGSYALGLAGILTGDISQASRSPDPLWYKGIRQHGNGEVTIGSGTGIRDYYGYTKVGSFEKMAELVKWGTKIIPALKDINIIRTWAGLKPASASRAAGGVIIDRVEFRDSCMYVVVDTGHAVARCPIVGKLAGEFITQGRENTSLPIEKCRLVNFLKENISTVR